MRLLTGLLCVLTLFGQHKDSRSSSTYTASDIAAGAKTFRSHCAECHGRNGEGGRGPTLATGVFYHGDSDEELLKNISDGIPGTEMPGLFYSPDRVTQVIAYLRSLSSASKNLVGNAASGAALFRSSGCQQCHRVGGDGGRQGPDLTEIGKIRSAAHLRAAVVDPSADVRMRFWVAKFKTDDGKGVSGFLMNEDTYTVQIIDFSGQLQSHSKSGLKDYRVEKVSAMPSYKDRLKANEVDDLISYLSSLRPQGGSQ